MNVAGLQTKLGVTADGVLGPLTYSHICSYAGDVKLGPNCVALGLAFASDFSKYDINTPERISAFIGQACEETERFNSFVELGGPQYFAKYDGRKDLGNSQAGDGYKYRGRGIFDTTGRYNYTQLTSRLNIDLVNNPDKLLDPVLATLVACMFWAQHNCNQSADIDDIQSITEKINGGDNGLVNRLDYTQRALALWN